MTENVIEQKITKWRSEQHDYPTHEAGQHAAAAVRLCTDELQAVTRPEQFMPPLRDWPEWANWCCLDLDCRLAFFEIEPKNTERYRYWVSRVGRIELGGIVVTPLGIDPRIKVSRAQMEKWEAERG